MHCARNNISYNAVINKKKMLYINRMKNFQEVCRLTLIHCYVMMRKQTDSAEISEEMCLTC